jgi:hypothetical protein
VQRRDVLDARGEALDLLADCCHSRQELGLREEVSARSRRCVLLLLRCPVLFLVR